ncbi:hypothetical protein [Massilia sp. TSP1-1-2]|uniref:hypothetical protein n=1 Tax=unclassified Massilia TaxID=2609279 RepID=UPI003CF08BA4
MSNLNKEIKDSKEENKDVNAVDIESLSDIVEAELDNVAGGGYSQIGATHSKNATRSPTAE